MRIISQPHKGSLRIKEDFFSISPFDPDAIKKARKQVLQQSYPREPLAAILKEYNQSFGNQDALPFIERLKNPESVCVVTGQQLGLMGGPAYTILKAVSCLLLARETDAIPVFWLATEDHDLHEIDHTYLIDPLGNLKEYKLHFSPNQFAEDLKLSQNDRDSIEIFLKDVGMLDFQQEIKNETSYIRAMAKFLKELFAGTGLVFLEPHLLRPLAKEFFRKEISQSVEIEKILQRTADQLKQEGLNPPLKISETNLFIKDQEGRRKKVNRNDPVLELLEDHPERFSTNAIARPVLQSLLIPTLAYVAGPSELFYHQQLREYFDFHACAMPWIAPRLSATFITSEWAQILEKAKMDPWNLPKSWEELFPHKTDLRAHVEKLGIPYASLHRLNNALYPHGKEQERVLNWCEFQRSTKRNLVRDFLDHANFSMNQNHLYVYL